MTRWSPGPRTADESVTVVPSGTTKGRRRHRGTLAKSDCAARRAPEYTFGSSRGGPRDEHSTVRSARLACSPLRPRTRITASRRTSTSTSPSTSRARVIEYEARNPHSYLHIAAVDENGKTQEYVCESHGVTQLTRNGITPAMLKPGTQLRVDGSLSRHSPYMCFFNNVYFPDGRALSVNGPRGAQAAPATSALPPRTDIFGTWLLAPAAPDPRRADTSRPQPMMNFLTPAGAGGRRGLRSVQGRSDVPLRSRRDPARLGRARHAALDHARAGTASCCATSGWTSSARCISNTREHPAEWAAHVARVIRSATSTATRSSSRRPTTRPAC